MDRQNAIRLLNETFNQNFELEKFTKFVTELFNRFNVNERTWNVWKEYQDYIDSYQLLGSYKDDSRKVIDVLVIKLKRTSSRDRARTMQRNFVAKYLGNAQKDAALVAFYGDDPEDWRFSFVKMEYHLVKDESGKVKPIKELTPARRYSFLVGVNEPNHTCRSQFLKLIMEEEVNPSLSEIEQAFSIDNVTREFFDKYKELFLELKESLEKVLKKDKNARKEFEEKNISTVDFAKKLLGQIVFIYFLQKKGWLGVQKIPKEGFSKGGTGPKDFLRKLFDKEIVPYDNFFNEILEPLFYEALATPRDDDYYSRFNCKIPFLNGGLFEPINDYDWAETDVVLDNSIFDRILSTFDRFNFTVKEDEPLEKEVAVDPEMLGKVFENLLEIKDRKSKGAFYTPREIVHYMCQQSLINYLETNTSIPRKDIEKFIQMGDVAIDQTIKAQEQKKKYHGRTYDIDQSLVIPKEIEKNHKELDELLKKIKIVDPACGSGAFLIGMLNEIVKARSLLAIFSNKEQSIYDAKREIIENCLYGVDIDPSAVEISKLRFWLSLVVDELDMKNIKPLPNLDHKIMCGNSLLEEFEGVKLFDERLLGEVKKDVSFEVKQIEQEINRLYKEKGDVVRGKSNDKTAKEIDKEIKKLQKKKQKILSGPKAADQQITLAESMQKKIKESKKKLAELKKLQEQFFNEQRRGVKKELREKIDKLEWDLIRVTLEEQGNEEALKKLEQYKKNKAKPFFLWKLYFAEVFQRDNPGFDVVIANPPYVRQEEIKDQKPFLQRAGYEVYNSTSDIYAYFYEKSYRLLKDNGILCFISSNKWMRAKYGEKLRKFFKTKTTIKQIIDFNGYKVFEATVDTNIIILQKEISPDDYRVPFVNIKSDFTGENLYRYLSEHQQSISLNQLNNNGWGLIDDKTLKLKQKIEATGTPLKNWDVKIYFGIKTGFNKAFIIDTETKEQLCAEDPQSAEIIKPILRGRDIGRYYYKWAGLWVIKIESGWTNKNCEKMKPEEFFKNKYPAIYNHLISSKNFKGKGKGLMDRDDQGDYWWELRDCDYYDEFEKEKIVWQEIVREPSFAYDSNKIYCEATTFLMTGQNLKYLLAILNSKPATFFFKQFYAGGGLGEKGYRYKKAFLERLPIPKIPESDQKPFIDLVDQILSITKSKDYLDNPDKQAKVRRLEKKIDQLVYKLYGLTKEEIKIVDFVNGGRD